MTNSEDSVYLPANDPDVFMIRDAAEAALREGRSLQFRIDNGALQIKLGEDMWSPPMFGDSDPKFTPDFP